MICGGRLSGDQAARVFNRGRYRKIGDRSFGGTANEACPGGQITFTRLMRPAQSRGDSENPSCFAAVRGENTATAVTLVARRSAAATATTRLLSQAGPGVCWHDINQDGWGDLIIGSGHGGHLTVLENRGTDFR
jgi:hypothetical protein